MDKIKRQEYEEIMGFLKLPDVEIAKSYLLSLLFFLNIFGTLIMIIKPFFQGDEISKIIFNICLPIIIFSDIWAIRIITNPKKRIKEYTLCAGILSFTTALVLYIGSIKIIYSQTEYIPVLFTLITFSFFIFFFVFQFYILHRAFRMGHYAKNPEISYVSSFKYIFAIIFLGPIIGNLVSLIIGSDLKIFFTALVCQMLGNVLLLFTPNIAKYFLIKKYEGFM